MHVHRAAALLGRSRADGLHRYSIATLPARSNVSVPLMRSPFSRRRFRSTNMMWDEPGLSSTVSPGLISMPSFLSRIFHALMSGPGRLFSRDALYRLRTKVQGDGISTILLPVLLPCARRI